MGIDTSLSENVTRYRLWKGTIKVWGDMCEDSSDVCVGRKVWRGATVILKWVNALRGPGKNTDFDILIESYSLDFCL